MASWRTFAYTGHTAKNSPERKNIKLFCIIQKYIYFDI
ncbi:hypothetical protein MNB_SV-10-1154 [hydrothermal vent metagenome]|uniref:Uncharacterized protein n=1 Tax=hydrothermal vent metagenome TaxID=652676 RepID=A0A1W1C714_9ZZZZ